MPNNNQINPNITWEEPFKNLEQLCESQNIHRTLYMEISAVHDMVAEMIRSEQENGQSQMDMTTLKALRQAYQRMNRLCEEYLISHNATDNGYNLIMAICEKTSAESERLENYNPGQLLLLSDILDADNYRQRTKTEELDLNRRVGQAMSARIPAKANGKNGYFTAEDTGEKPEKFYNEIKNKSNFDENTKSEYDPLFKMLTTNEGIAGFVEMINDPEWNVIYNGFIYADDNEEMKAPFYSKFSDMLHKAGASDDFINQYLHREDFPDVYTYIFSAYISVLAGTQYNYQYAGIAGDANIEKRNAATSKVGDLIGMTDLMAYSTTMTATIDGKEVNGVFMEEAKGYTTPELKTKVEQYDGVDYNEEALLKQVSDIQALDYICGSTDRHEKNVIFQFDEENKKITGIKGIDNDMSFGNLPPESIAQGKRYMAGPDNMLLLRKSTADRILSLSHDELKNSLKGLIRPDEIESAWKRTEILQDRILQSMKREAEAKKPLGDDLSMGQLRILKDDDPLWQKLNFAKLGQQAGSRSLFGQISKEKLFEKAPNQPDILDARPKAEIIICTTETEQMDQIGIISSKEISNIYKISKNGLTKNYPEEYDYNSGKRYFQCHVEPLMKKEVFSSRIYKTLGFKDITDCIYCDGKKVKDVLRENYGLDKELKDPDKLKARIAELMLSGKHQLSLVNIQKDSDGKGSVNVSDIKVDLTNIDYFCKDLPEKPSKTAERLNKISDETRENRFANITEIIKENYRNTYNTELENGEMRLPSETIEKNKFESTVQRNILKFNDSQPSDKRIDSNLQRLLLNPEAISGYMEMFETKHVARIVRWNSGTYNDTLKAMKEYNKNAESFRELVVKMSEETDPQKLTSIQTEFNKSLEKTKESYKKCQELLPKYVQKVLGDNGNAMDKNTGTGFARAAGAQGLESEFLTPSVENNAPSKRKGSSHNEGKITLKSLSDLYKDEMTTLKDNNATNKHRKAAKTAHSAAKKKFSL